MEIIEIFTDGSSLGNPGPGGYAAIIRINKKETVIKGGEKNTTNNRMELRAVIEAFSKLPFSSYEFKDKKIAVYSDSRLLVETMRKGWKKKENIDLWKMLENLCEEKNIEWHWVKGHAAHPENLKADEIANAEAWKMSKTNKFLHAHEPSKKTPFFCNRCMKPTAGKLTALPENGLIRADCEHCGKFIKFAKHTKEILKRAEASQKSLF